MASVPPGYEPAWLTHELEQLLGKLRTRKERTTVLQMAEGRAMGRSETKTLRLPDTCTKSTWDGQYRRSAEGEPWVRRPGWKDRADVQAALESATARAQRWQDTEEARRIAKRQTHLAAARDLLAEYSPLAVQRLFVLMGAAGNEETRRKAANDILDRADEETAAKSVVQESGAHERTHKFDLSDVPTELLELFASLGQGDGNGPGEGREGGTE